MSHPDRVNFMKNLPSHELSRRRLQQPKAKSLPAAPSPEAQEAQEAAEGHSSSSEADDYKAWLHYAPGEMFVTFCYQDTLGEQVF